MAPPSTGSGGHDRGRLFNNTAGSRTPPDCVRGYGVGSNHKDRQRSSSYHIRRASTGVSPRRVVDWTGFGEKRRAAAPPLSSREPQPTHNLASSHVPRIPSTDTNCLQHIGNGSDYPDDGRSHAVRADQPPTLGSPFRTSTPRSRHHTWFEGYAPASQLGNGQYYQPHALEREISAASTSPAPDFGSAFFTDPNAIFPDSTVGGQHSYHQPGTDHLSTQSDAWLDSGNDLESFSQPALQLQPPPNTHQRFPENTIGWPLFTNGGNTLEQSFYQIGSSGTDPGSAVPTVPSERQPFHKLFANENPLCWANSAFQLGLSLPPRQCAIQINDEWYNYWLPCQDDFRNWDGLDATFLIKCCTDLGIEVDWQALDTYGSQLLPLPQVSRPRGDQKPQDPLAGLQHVQSEQLHVLADGELHNQYTSPPQDQTALQDGPHADEAIENYSAMQVTDSSSKTNLPQQIAPQPVLSMPGLAPIQNSLVPPLHAPRHRLLNSTLLRSQTMQQEQLSSENPRPNGSPSRFVQPQVTALSQTPQSQSAPQAQQSKPRKALKRWEHNSDTMLQPSASMKSTIELLTADDRKKYQKTPDTAWWSPNVDNSTVPETEEEQQDHVQLLKEAMMDTSQANDKKGPTTPFNKRWSAAALAKNGYPTTTKEMEATCWELVQIAVELHKNGPGFLQIHDQRLQDKLEKEQDLTFQQRIDTMVTILLLSKARVDKLMKHENLGSFVGHPMDILRATKGNRDHNEKRKQQNQRGKRGLKEDAEQAAAAAAAATAANANATTPAAAEAEEEVEEIEEVEEVEEIEEIEEIEEGEEAGEEIEDDENQELREHHEKDEDDDAEGSAEEDDKNEDGDEHSDDAGDSMGIHHPDFTPDDEVDGDNTAQPDSRDEADNGSRTWKRPSSSAYSSQARAQPPLSAMPMTRFGTHVPFQAQSHSNATTLRGRHAPSRQPETHASPLPRRAPQPAASHDAPYTPPGGSRKRPATIHHGLSLPSPPKRCRNASYVQTDDELINDKPRTSNVEPELVLATKRRAAEANLEDTNTREKSARTVDRQIIAPKRMSRPAQ